ncbi:MAG: thioredoxin domain-containing protein [Deltaproteobacteria bacterium]|nr:thioredoxin domain-containing protein [Deltaproteobacteria bacterium]
MRRLLALLVLAACAHEQHDAQLEQRLAVIEQRLDAQQRALDEARHHDSDVELSALAAQVEALRAEIAAMPAPKKAAPKRPEPDRNALYAVSIGTSPTYGPATAKVTLVMAGDFACPYCRRAWTTVDELRKKYGKDLRVVYKSFIVHPHVATDPAHGACAAAHQGKFHEMADLLWSESFEKHDFDPKTIETIAKHAKLDMKRYTADVAGPCPAEIAAENAEMTKLGVVATPTFFINGRYMSGAMPIEDFEKLIDEEAAKADAAIKSGVKPEQYYDTQILAKGLQEPTHE